MPESELFASVGDFAKAAKNNEAYLRRVLRLPLLSLKITEAILSGRQRQELKLTELLKPFPIEWESRKRFY